MIKCYIDTTYSLAVLSEGIIGSALHIDVKVPNKQIRHELGTVGTLAILSRGILK